MSEQNYGELFCEAVDTIVKQRLQGVAFDQTILCTIIDDSKREQGIYKVSNGSSQFEAYSSITDYRNNNNVYVQIPQGDWNSSKFIIGKKNKEDIEEAFIYKNPLYSFIDITKNIIPIDFTEGEASLIANLSDDKILWSYNNINENALYKKEGKNFNSYTRLGIQASFCSLVNPFTASDGKVKNVTKGDYGLKLRLEVLKDKTFDELEQKIEYYDFFLNTNDMNGNPYNFSTYFQQEKLFDISDFKEIKSMSLAFYQNNEFMSDDGTKLPSTDFLGNNLIQPNLFVKDIYISLGYGTEEFDDEKVLLFTNNDSSYKKTADPEYKNQKQIELRWIHKKDDGSYQSVTEDDKLDFEIRWYRYSLGAPSVDRYSDVYWKLLSLQSTKHNNITDFWDEAEKDNIFNKIFDALIQDEDKGYYIDQKKEQNQEQTIYININEEFQKNNSRYFIRDKRWIEDNYNLKSDSVENWKQYTRYPDFFSTWIMPSLALSQEQVKAVILYNGKAYYSNTITFTNEDEVVSRPTVDAIQALTINCEDGTYGNYRIYAEGNQLINSKDASEEREFELYFKSEYDETEPTYWIGEEKVEEGADGAEPRYPLIAARNAEWVFPSENSMIKLPSEYIDYFAESTEKNPNKVEGNLYWIDDNKNYHIKRFGNASDSFKINNKQPYYIGSYYSEQYSNNTITCTIEKEPNTFFTATKTLTFGIAGTTGTDVTLVIDFENSKIDAIDIQDKDTAYIFVANLYDSENKNITEEAKKISTFNWGFINKDEFGSFTPGASFLSATGDLLVSTIADNNNNNNKNKCEVKYTASETEINKDSWNILVCKVEGWGDYPLIAYFPIPLKRKTDNINPYYIQGTSQIIYNAEGTPSYYKGPYKIFGIINGDDSKIVEQNKNILWKMSYEDVKLTSDVIESYKAKKEQIAQLEKDLRDTEYEIDQQKLYDANADVTALEDEKKQLKEDINRLTEETINITKNKNQIIYYPKLQEQENVSMLFPLNFYIQDSSYGINVLCYDITDENNKIIIWSQPLLIMQNRYPSAMLNAWDGNLKIDEEGNSIAAAKIAAGKKDENDNTFSGVLLGDVSDQSIADGKVLTGLYGFNKGEVSFAFKEDGTGYIGKSGRGRILFDGDEGVIESPFYEKNDGMRINLDDAFIDMVRVTNTSQGKYAIANINSQEDFNSYKDNNIQLYYFYDYVLKDRVNDYQKESDNIYIPYSYEEVQMSNNEYIKLMSQYNCPRFYSYYQIKTYPKVDYNDEDEVTGSIMDGGILYPGDDYLGENGGYWGDSGYVTIEDPIYDSKFDYKLLDQMDLNSSTIKNMHTHEEGKKEEVDENGNITTTTIALGPEYNYYPTIISGNEDSDENTYLIHIPSSFKRANENEKNNLNTYFKIDRNIESNYKKVEYNDNDNDDSNDYQYDPTAKYFTARYEGEKEEEKQRYISITAQDKKIPLSIGTEKVKSSRNFRVEWDGTVHIENGYFGGTIDATSGSLGNLTVYGTLSGGIISGAQISGSQIKGSSVNANYLYCNNGKIGGWNIGGNYLRAGRITLDSGSGQIIGGTIRGSTLYSSSGEIGGWIITSGKLYGGSRIKDSKGKYNYAIELDSTLGAIRGGAILTNYNIGKSETMGTIETLQGGTILDGFFTIAAPDTAGTDPITLPKKYDKSYLGYISGGLSDSQFDNDLSDGIGMMMGNGSYEGSKVLKDNWFSVVTATSKGAGLAVSTGNQVQPSTIQTIADDNDTGGEDTGGTGTGTTTTTPYNKIFINNKGIKLSTNIVENNKISSIELNTNDFSTRNVADNGFQINAYTNSVTNTVELSADNSFNTSITLQDNGTTGSSMIQSRSSIFLNNIDLGQYISMGHKKEESAVMLLAAGDDNDTGGSEGGNGSTETPSPPNSGSGSDTAVNYIEISPGISIGSNTFFSSGSIKINDYNNTMELSNSSLSFKYDSDSSSQSSTFGVGGFSAEALGNSIDAGAGKLTVSVVGDDGSASTTIEGGSIDCTDLTATKGDIKATLGNISAEKGDISATLGNISAEKGTITGSGIKATSTLDATGATCIGIYVILA